MNRGPKALLVGGAVLAVVAGVVLSSRDFEVPGLPVPDRCVAEIDGHQVDLDPEQAGNAATIAAVSVRRGLPPRAASIALATAMQESKLRNLDHGDRDSLGLFQQRPSQGWGTPAQVQDPVYASNRFYDALVKVDGYQDRDLGDVAQEVQRSGYPDAYDQHVRDARVLASSLTGQTVGGAFECRVQSVKDPGSQDVNEVGLVEDADVIRRELGEVFGDLPMGGFAPEGVTSGHMSRSAHYSGRAVDVFVRPVGPANKQKGWAIAAYLVAHAERLGVDHVIFDGRIWASGLRSGQGWRDYRVPSGASGDRAVLEHRDHVHVDVSD